MPTARAEMMKIAARARLVFGNDSVETGNGRQDWLFRITCPDGYRVQLHSSPSDRNWKNTVERELNAHGFAEALEAYERAEEDRRLESLKEAEEKNRQRFAEVKRRADHAQSRAKAAGPYAPQPVDIDWLFTPHELPETRRVLLTPEIAQEILDKLNSANRPLRPGRVAYWASIIKKGRWRFTHQGIAFDTRGWLQDGQHRLKAAIQENYTLDILISVGMPTDNFGVVDVGAARSGADTLARLGKTNYKNLSGSIRLTAVYDRYGPEFRAGEKVRIPNDEIEELSEKYGELLEQAVSLAHTVYNRGSRGGPRMSPVAAGCGIYLISRNLPDGVNDDRVVEFLRGYSEGTGLFAGDARLPLRSYMSNLVDNKNRKVPAGDQLAIFLKAWKAWINNEAANFLSWRKSELMPEVALPPVYMKKSDLPDNLREDS